MCSSKIIGLRSVQSCATCKYHLTEYYLNGGQDLYCNYDLSFIPSINDYIDDQQIWNKNEQWKDEHHTMDNKICDCYDNFSQDKQNDRPEPIKYPYMIDAV